MITLAELMRSRDCRPIRNCPGRYVVADCPPDSTPEQIVRGVRVSEYRVGAARDPVLVAALEQGGLISYRHADGTFTHTLNDEAGFRRKLVQLGITLHGLPGGG